MNFNIKSALVGVALGFGLVAGISVGSSTAARADDCSLDYAEGSRQQDACLMRKAREMHNLRGKKEDECERGGCGPKAGKIQKQMNRKTNTFEADQD